MPNNKPKILVLGATGQVGKNVISHLITNDKVEVIAAARSPEKAKDLGVPVVYLDLDKPESIAPALKGIDRAFLATGYTIDMMRQSKDFLNIAKKAGAEPAYMKCVFDSYTELTNGTAVKPDEVFDNLPAIIGRKPRTLADFAKKHADKFRYQLTEKIV
jgi:NAD(P)-dependent dehydrogenase (short-subunit alcohol dehydrogenase family)